MRETTSTDFLAVRVTITRLLPESAPNKKNRQMSSNVCALMNTGWRLVRVEAAGFDIFHGRWKRKAKKKKKKSEHWPIIMVRREPIAAQRGGRRRNRAKKKKKKNKINKGRSSLLRNNAENICERTGARGVREKERVCLYFLATVPVLTAVLRVKCGWRRAIFHTG